MRSVRYRYGRLKAAVYALKAGNDIIMFNYPYKSELKVIKEYYSLYKKYEDDILIEQFILGREFSVGILDGKALPSIEIIPTSEG